VLATHEDAQNPVLDAFMALARASAER
jgi:hypothetical protein